MCLKIKKYNFEGRTHPFTFIPQEFQGQMCVNLTLGEVVSAPREYKWLILNDSLSFPL